MDVSVVITCFQQDRTVLLIINDFLQQTEKVKEIIVVDDGGTMDKITKKKIEDNKIVRLFSIKHQGVSAARNFGITHATSKYVFVADGDDRYDITLIHKLHNTIKSCSRFVGVSCWLRTKVKEKEIILKPNGGGQKEFLCQCSCPGSILLNREHWERCGKYDEHMRQGFEEWEFYIRLTAKNKKIKIYEEALIEYTFPERSANSLYYSNRKKWINYIYKKHKDIFLIYYEYILNFKDEQYRERIKELFKGERTVIIGDGSIEATNGID